MDIKEYREMIDNLDKQISFLINKRFFITKVIGQIKKDNGINVEDVNRENEILESFNNLENRESIKKIYKEIFKLSKEQQNG